MAIGVNWVSLAVDIPKADTTLVDPGPPNEVRSIDLDTLRRDLRALEASEAGIVFPRVVDYSGPRTIAGIDFAAFVEFVNGYFPVVEVVGGLPAGVYALQLLNANTNFQDVNLANGVSIYPTNSAGLIGSQQIKETWQHRGLDPDNPLEIDDDEQRVGDITLSVSDDGTTTTVQRS